MPFRRSSNGYNSQPEQGLAISKGHPLARSLWMAGSKPVNSDGKFGLLTSVEYGTAHNVLTTQKHGSVMSLFNTNSYLEYRNLTFPSFPVTLMVECINNDLTYSSAFIGLGKVYDGTNGCGIRMGSGGTAEWEIMLGGNAAYATGIFGAIKKKYMVALTVTASGTAKFYVDGKLVKTNSFSAPAAPTDTLSLGVLRNNAMAIGSELNGAIGFFGVWERVLAADEIRSLFINPYQIAVGATRSKMWVSSGSLTGVVTEAGAPVIRVVRAYNRSTGVLIGSTTSNADGNFSISANGYTGECFVVAFTTVTGPPSYNAVIYDGLIPV